MRTLYHFKITDNQVIDGKTKLVGHYEKVEEPSSDEIDNAVSNSLKDDDQVIEDNDLPFD